MKRDYNNRMKSQSNGEKLLSGSEWYEAQAYRGKCISVLGSTQSAYALCSNQPGTRKMYQTQKCKSSNMALSECEFMTRLVGLGSYYTVGRTVQQEKHSGESL